MSVDFSGVSMNMGYNRIELRKLSRGRFSGQATLPACITGRMTWQAMVVAEHGKMRVAAPFRFEAGR